MNTKINRLLVHQEGSRLVAYKDTLGHWTVGVGHLLPPQFAKYLDMGAKLVLTQECMNNLFYADVAVAQRIAAQWLGDTFADLNDARRDAVVSMAFQLGPNTFKFKDCRLAIQNERWIDAHQEMLWADGYAATKKSEWFRDTPGRCIEVAEMVLTGEYPNWMKEEK